MENTASTYSGAEGRGGATILQPVDFSDLFAQNINTMRSIRSMQDKIEANKQKELSDMLDVKLPEKVWNQTEQELSEMLSEYIDDASKTYAKYETNSGYKIPASEQLRLKNLKSEIARYATSSVTAREAIEEVFKQARADKKADLDSLYRNLNTEILYAQNKAKEQGDRWLNHFRPETITFDREPEPYSWLEVKPDITEGTGFSSGSIGGEQGVITTTTKRSNTTKAIKTSFNNLKTDVLKGNYAAKQELSTLDAMAINEGYKSAEDAINSGKENAVSTYIAGQSKIQNINETNKSFSRNPESGNSYGSGSDWMKANGIVVARTEPSMGAEPNGGQYGGSSVQNGTIRLTTAGKTTPMKIAGHYFPYGVDLNYEGGKWYYNGKEEIYDEYGSKTIIDKQYELDKSAYLDAISSKGAANVTNGGIVAAHDAIIESSKNVLPESAINTLSGYRNGLSGVQFQQGGAGSSAVVKKKTEANDNKQQQPKKNKAITGKKSR